MKAIVLAAGRGLRMGSSAHEMPKVMLAAADKPLLSYVLDNISFIPQDKTAIVVGYKKDVVIDEIGGKYLYAQQEQQLGTGHAVQSAREVFGDDLSGEVLVCYGDMPLFSRGTYGGLLAEHKKTGADCTVLSVVAPNSGLHYGRIIRDNGVFTQIIEYEECTEEEKKINELNSGVYVFNMKLMFDMLEQLISGSKKENYYLTDLPKLMLAEGLAVETYTTYNSNEIYGVNTPDELKLVDEILRRIKRTAKASPEPKWFGTGGWRALIGEGFTKDNVRILSQAIADDMKSKDYKEIVVGYDRRFLSDKAAAWASEVFAGNGISVYFVSRISPTPLIMFTVKNKNTKYGISITASHNPAEYNGVKVFTEGGRDASAETTSQFEHIISQRVTPVFMDFDEGVREGIIRIIDPNNEYIDSIISMIDMNAIREGQLRVLLDPMYGVSKTTLQTILMTARCDVDLINENRDALFGGQLPSPTEETLSKLKEMVIQNGYDLGIGTDGDADRIGIIDKNGKYIHPNEILMLLYYYLLEYKNWEGDCVRNIATTHLLDKIAEDAGFKCHEVPVGFKHISSKMEQTDAIIGGESSGGLTIKGHIKGKDGIFASTLIVEMICVTKKSLSQLLEDIYAKYGKAEMVEYDVKFTEQKKAEIWQELFVDKLIPNFGIEVERINFIDGCKIYFKNNGWIIARFSGTEPLLRIFCEMENKEKALEIVGIMRGFLGT